MSPARPLPTDRPVLAWYGDDFTGAAAVMEVLTFAGLDSVLFLETPTPDLLARFPAARAIGLAGDARARPPDWMRRHLPGIFKALRGTGAPLLHYKVCSTLDSAPHIGSIGCAADLALGETGWAPLLLAAPEIGRWQAFGNLFARDGSAITRLDRHRTMAVHPVTPMHESDVRRHLAAQTDRRIDLVDLVDLKAGRGAARLAEALAAGAAIVAFDVVDAETLAEVGRLIWHADPPPDIVLGSQGLEYALVAAWRAEGLLPETAPSRSFAATDRVAVVSGSCSPVTAGQIAAAEAAGFATIALDPARAADPGDWQAACDAARDTARAALTAGRSALVHTARGPDDPRIAAFEAIRRNADDTPARVGTGLGHLLAGLVDDTGLGRVAIAGGDTSSHGAAALDLFALTAQAMIAPGAPLLRGHAAAPGRDGLEILLKGGQMGPPDIFVQLRDGTVSSR